MCKRIKFIFITLMCLLLVLDFGRYFWLQVIADDKYRQAAQDLQLDDTTVTPMRGTIYDAQKNVLVQSATVYNVYLNTKKLNDEENIKAGERETLLNGLAELLGYDETKKAEMFTNAETASSYLVVEKKIEPDKKAEISKYISDHSKEKYANYIGLTPTSKRYYQNERFATSVLGFTGTDDQGITGIEKVYDTALTGTPGRIITARDALRNKLPDGYESSIDAKNGNSLVLTIDQAVQSCLDEEMAATVNEYNAKGGYGVVMDVRTGAVLAMTSLPDYSLSDPWSISSTSVQNEIDKIADETAKKNKRTEELNRQWKNKVVSDVYVPGSVFKVFVASAAIEENLFSLTERYNCTGTIVVQDRTFRCHLRTGHGVQTIADGLANSCNPFFITVGQRLGIEKFCKYFEAFGFTEKTGIDLPGEGNSIYVKEKDMTPVSLASASFGQTNSLTPIQVCTALCAIANGGKLMQPYMVSEILDDQGNTVSKTEPKVKRQVLSQQTCNTVLGMMNNVVAKGTGKNGYVAGYSVGGKTGTSTKLGESAAGEKTKYLASFAAVAPTDDPRIAVLIIIDEPDQDLGGGALAAPIAASVVETALKGMNVEPKYTQEESAKFKCEAPNLAGASVAAAKTQLSNGGFNYKVVGTGEKVVKQSPAAGSVIPQKATIVLYTDTVDASDTTTVPDFSSMSVTQANAAAATAGININLAGNSLTANDTSAYRQSVAPGTTVEKGMVVTVYFKHTSGISDRTD